MRPAAALACGLAAAFLAGCPALTTTTHIQFNPKTQMVTIDSPKDVSFSGLTLSVDERGYSLIVQDYSSDANAEAMRVIGEDRESTRQAIKEAVMTGIELGKGVVPVPIP